MIKHAQRALPGTLRQRLTAIALATLMAGGAAGGFVHGSIAQDDGTGADIPTGPLACVIVRADTLPVAGAATPHVPEATPALDAATPIASEDATPAIGDATPVASPVVEMATPMIEAATPMASPVEDMATPVSDAATPLAPQMTEEPPVDANGQVMEDVTGVVTALISCLNERDFETYVALSSDMWRGAMFGIEEPLEADLFIDLARVLPATENRLLEVTNLQVVNETTVTVDVTYITASQLMTSRWTLTHQRVQGLPTWVLQSGEALPVQAPQGAAVIDVDFGDASYTVNPATVPGPDVVLNLSNPTGSLHEALVLKLAEGMTTDAVLQSTDGTLPDGVQLIGQATVAPGGEGQLVLTGLEPGTYTIVDLLPGESGLPHLSAGMEATFTVEP